MTYGEITATARVRLELGTNVMAGLVLRRDTSNTQAYFVGIRNTESGYYCGIYEKSGSTWTNRTPGLTSCKYATGGWHTLMVRAAGGRIEMHVDGALITTWADATPLPAYGFGLMTFDGAASFDNIKVHGLSTRSYYMFGSARVAERTTTHGYAAGSSTGTGGGARFVLHTDHLGSVSLATNSSGMTVTNSLARFFPFGAERGAAPSGSPTDWGYATGRNSPSLGLVHLGARWYDLRAARWTSADTIVPGSPALAAGSLDPTSTTEFARGGKDSGSSTPIALNRYAYLGNNPLRGNDPDGHCYPFCTMAAGAIIGFGAYMLTTGTSPINVDLSNGISVSYNESFEWDEAITVALAGAVAGTAIAAPPVFGMTAAAGASAGVVAMGTAVSGVGVGIASGGLGYMVGAGSDFNKQDFGAAVITNGAAGAFGALGKGASTAAGAIAGAAQSAWMDANAGNPVDPGKAALSFLVGGTSGFVGGTESDALARRLATGLDGTLRNSFSMTTRQAIENGLGEMLTDGSVKTIASYLISTWGN